MHALPKIAIPALGLLLVALPAAGSTVLEWPAGAGTTGALVEDHRVPIVELRIEFPAGTWMPWVRENHAAEAFEIQLYDPGARLRKRSDELAADLFLEVGTHDSTLALSCRKSEIDDCLDLTRAVLANTEFDRDELAGWHASSRIEWKSALREPSFVVSRTVAQLLFEQDDVRRVPYEPPPAILTDPKRLLRARDVVIRLPGRVVGFAGDLTLAEAQSLARDLLPAPTSVPPQGLVPKLGTIVPRRERPDEANPRIDRLTQAYFAYARDSLALASPDYASSMIADHALGGHFNSRLMAALRHEGGETYDAGIEEESGVEPGSYALTTFTHTDNARAVATKLRDLLERFHADGITEEERALAAGSVVGSRAFARQSPAQLLDEFLWERRHGLPRGYRDRLAQAAAALSLDEVNAFIRRFYDPRSFTMVTLESGPARK